MTTPLSTKARALIERPIIATVATVGPDAVRRSRRCGSISTATTSGSTRRGVG